MFRTASFDIGKHNFAIYVEDFSLDKFTRIKQKDSDSLIKEICHLGKRIYLDNVSLVNDKPIQSFLAKRPKGRTYLSDRIFKNMTVYLDGLAKDGIFNNLNQVIIEEQRKFNYECIKLAQHCYSYFIIKYPDITVEYIPSAYKTIKLGVPTQITTRYQKVADSDFSLISLRAFKVTQLREYVKTNKIHPEGKKKMQIIKAIQEFNGIVDTKGGLRKSIKVWTVKNATQIFTDRKDSEGLKIIKQYKSKADDICDTINQCQGFKVCVYENILKGKIDKIEKTKKPQKWNAVGLNASRMIKKR